MTSDARLTESVRVRLTSVELEALAAIADDEDRSISAIARRAVRAEIERARKQAKRKG